MRVADAGGVILHPIQPLIKEAGTEVSLKILTDNGFDFFLNTDPNPIRYTLDPQHCLHTVKDATLNSSENCFTSTDIVNNVPNLGAVKSTHIIIECSVCMVKYLRLTNRKIVTYNVFFLFYFIFLPSFRNSESQLSHDTVKKTIRRIEQKGAHYNHNTKPGSG